MPRNQIRMTVYASLMAALTAAGAYIVIPIGPVPIVLQNFFVLLTGLLLGWRWGTASVALYLFAGLIGLPVFAGGTGGLGRFVGPTGGYLIGYLPAVFLIGLISELLHRRWWADLIAMILGSAIVYLLGVSWLKLATGMSFAKTLSVGLYPFIIGDLVKIVVALPVAKALRPIVDGIGYKLTISSSNKDKNETPD
jgi:biotin transport system substrate-specific component